MSPEGPYEFSGAGCNQLISLTLRASDQPYYTPEWDYVYESKLTEGNINVLLTEKRVSNYVVKSLEFRAIFGNKSQTSVYENLCESALYS